ncbi:MAG: DEAD/DEAH box helicase [Gemmataceae bacterium]|nr:DEAD/DEAH box helicase [Gemmataceae bacterium]MDW8263742.1 DEAD/DEAH box helicase [Gemmataceae bacterium]
MDDASPTVSVVPLTPDIGIQTVALDVTVEATAVPLAVPPEVEAPPAWRRGWPMAVRDARLLTEVPWVRSLGKLPLEIGSQGWRFPTPPDQPLKARPARLGEAAGPRPASAGLPPAAVPPAALPRTRPKPPRDLLLLKDRLLYLLQPPLESLFAGKQVQLPYQPYPYQVQGIAFLMPRHAALLADEMGLGKTAQVIIALRLLLHGGLLQRVLIVCPKPLVLNWSRELRLWAEDVPFEVIGGEYQARRTSWLVSNCPVKLVNYELLTRDAAFLTEEGVRFDLVVLDEAQRIKNREAKTAQVVRSIRRERSWAMTGTPIENKPEDLVNIFAFLDPERIPPNTPAKQLPQFTSDCILRRTKEEVAPHVPPKMIRDTYLELTPAQRAAYDLAEKEGVIRLNALGDTITVQHVFELVMRLKQICNFDPLTGQSAKLEQLLADLAEIAESGRKAIVFSQWVEPLEQLAVALKPFGPLLYHGRVPPKERQAVLDRFRTDPGKHVLLMSYGTGSVGLNLQFSNYVFLFDRWWNPAIEDQAINRAHRLGQREPVFVTRFISQGTIEGRIHEVLERKRQVFNELIERSGPPPSLGLTEEEIFGLFDIRNRPRRMAA